VTPDQTTEASHIDWLQRLSVDIAIDIKESLDDNYHCNPACDWLQFGQLILAYPPSFSKERFDLLWAAQLNPASTILSVRLFHLTAAVAWILRDQDPIEINPAQRYKNALLDLLALPEQTVFASLEPSLIRQGLAPKPAHVFLQVLHIARALLNLEHNNDGQLTLPGVLVHGTNGGAIVDVQFRLQPRACPEASDQLTLFDWPTDDHPLAQTSIAQRALLYPHPQMLGLAGGDKRFMEQLSRIQNFVANAWCDALTCGPLTYDALADDALTDEENSTVIDESTASAEWPYGYDICWSLAPAFIDKYWGAALKGNSLGAVLADGATRCLRKALFDTYSLKAIAPQFPLHEQHRLNQAEAQRRVTVLLTAGITEQGDFEAVSLEGKKEAVNESNQHAWKKGAAGRFITVLATSGGSPDDNSFLTHASHATYENFADFTNSSHLSSHTRNDPIEAVLNNETQANILKRDYRGKPFYGRGWLDEQLRTMIREKSAGYYFLTAPGGWGKTAWLYQWLRGARLCEGVSVVGSVILRRSEWDNGAIALKHLVAQLYVRFALDLSFPHQPPSDVESALSFWGTAYKKTLDFISETIIGRAEGAQKILILIDGLDESLGATSGMKTDLNEAITALLPALPPNIYVLLTSRAEGGIDEAVQMHQSICNQLAPIYLHADYETPNTDSDTGVTSDTVNKTNMVNNTQDVNEYISQRCAAINKQLVLTDTTPVLITTINPRGKEEDNQKTLEYAVRKAAESNFMAAINLLGRELQAEAEGCELRAEIQAWQADPTSIPTGLHSWFIEREWQPLFRQYRTRSLAHGYYRLAIQLMLGLVATMRIPLNEQQLQALFYAGARGSVDIAQKDYALPMVMPNNLQQRNSLYKQNYFISALAAVEHIAPKTHDGYFRFTHTAHRDFVLGVLQEPLTYTKPESTKSTPISLLTDAASAEFVQQWLASALVVLSARPPQINDAYKTMGNPNVYLTQDNQPEQSIPLFKDNLIASARSLYEYALLHAVKNLNNVQGFNPSLKATLSWALLGDFEHYLKDRVELFTGDNYQALIDDYADYVIFGPEVESVESSARLHARAMFRIIRRNPMLANNYMPWVQALYEETVNSWAETSDKGEKVRAMLEAHSYPMLYLKQGSIKHPAIEQGWHDELLLGSCEQRLKYESGTDKWQTKSWLVMTASINNKPHFVLVDPVTGRRHASERIEVVEDGYSLNCLEFASGYCENGTASRSCLWVAFSQNGNVLVWFLFVEEQPKRMSRDWLLGTAVQSGHGEVTALSACGDQGQYLASGGENGAIVLWEIEKWLKARREGQCYYPKKTAVAHGEHGRWVKNLCTCGDRGQYLASSGGDGDRVVALWEIEKWIKTPREGRPYHPRKVTVAQSGYGEWVATLCACGNRGQYLAAGGYNLALGVYKGGGAIVLWEIEVWIKTPREGQPIKGTIAQGDQCGLVSTLSACGDLGQYLASAGEDGAVVLWEIETWIEAWKEGQPYYPRKITGAQNDHSEPLTFLCACGDRRQYLASGGEEGSVVLWDIEKWKKLREDRPYLLIASSNTQNGHGGLIESFSTCGDRMQYLISTGVDGSVVLWDIEKWIRTHRVGQPHHSMRGAGASGNRIDILRRCGDRGQFLTAIEGEEGVIVLWDIAEWLETLREGHPYPAIKNAVAQNRHGQRVHILCVCGDREQYLVSALEEGEIILWEIEKWIKATREGQPYHPIRGTIPHGNGVPAEALSACGDRRQYLASSGIGGLIALWEIEKWIKATREGQPYHPIGGTTAHRNGVSVEALSACGDRGQYLASAVNGDIIDLWEIEEWIKATREGQSLHLIEGLTPHRFGVPIQALSACGDRGQYLASVRYDGVVVLWNLDGPKACSEDGTSSPYAKVKFVVNIWIRELKPLPVLSPAANLLLINGGTGGVVSNIFTGAIYSYIPDFEELVWTGDQVFGATSEGADVLLYELGVHKPDDQRAD